MRFEFNAETLHQPFIRRIIGLYRLKVSDGQDPADASEQSNSDFAELRAVGSSLQVKKAKFIG